MRNRITDLGILPIDKPSGMTSHDVVAKVRKALQTKKVGHAGTLDPLATGVLVVCVGRATRLSNYLTGQRKRYRTKIQLGVETDTLDADGKIVHRSDAVPGSPGEIETVLGAFRGVSQQTPPMYSARKVGGKRLHKLAREGKVVEREAREIEVYALDLLNYSAPFLDLDISCSKGTYVRSLASDIGAALGCGASVTALRRTESGTIKEADCVALDNLTPDVAADRSIDPNIALAQMPGVLLDAGQIERFAHGNDVVVGNALTEDESAESCRVTDRDGAFWGIGRMERGILRPVCVLRETGRAREAHPA